jgi:AraC-like DNA-binding protein
MLQNHQKKTDPLALSPEGVSAQEPRGTYEVVRARPDIWLCITRSEAADIPDFRLDAAEPVLTLNFRMPRNGRGEENALASGSFSVLPPGRHLFTGMPPRGLVLCITEYRLRTILADDAHTLPAKILSALALREYTTRTPEAVPLFPEQILAANALMQCSYAGAVRNMFIKSKILELVALFFLKLAEPGYDGRMLSPGERAVIAAARDYFLANLENLPTIPQLARRAGTSESKLQRLFKEAYGVSAGAYLRRERMAAARGLLLFQGANVSEAALAVGYNNVSHFIDVFTRHYGLRPGEIRSRR